MSEKSHHGRRHRLSGEENGENDDDDAHFHPLTRNLLHKTWTDGSGKRNVRFQQKFLTNNLPDFLLILSV